LSSPDVSTFRSLGEVGKLWSRWYGLLQLHPRREQSILRKESRRQDYRPGLGMLGLVPTTERNDKAGVTGQVGSDQRRESYQYIDLP
jgi:hypothetical protein